MLKKFNKFDISFDSPSYSGSLHLPAVHCKVSAPSLLELDCLFFHRVLSLVNNPAALLLYDFSLTSLFALISRTTIINTYFKYLKTFIQHMAMIMYEMILLNYVTRAFFLAYLKSQGYIHSLICLWMNMGIG